VLTATQLEERKRFIGSSDMPAILGISPWATPADVWLQKTGRLETKPDDPTEAMEIGNMVEAPLLGWCAEKIGKPLVHGYRIIHRNGIMAANLDGAVLNVVDGVIEHAEAKSSSKSEGWGEPGTADIPEHYLVQIAQQFACAPTSAVCHVPVLMTGFRPQRLLYGVERGTAADIIQACEEFAVCWWEKHVVKDTPPEAAPSLALSKLIRRRPGRVVSIPDAAFVQGWKAMKLQKAAADRAAREIEKAFEPLDAKMRLLLDGADEASTPCGTVIAKLVNRKAYAVEASSYVTLKIEE
jgi:putative phage-type endonuclease